ncbi:MAG: hypothetical protein J3Q66DRAFT_371387 [Benniella sp.]|nr:MAG: hypothetical protein J3Q66DRAFT_371387 [Benniella sp.]
MTALNKVDDFENVDLVEEMEIIKKHWIKVGISDKSVDSDTLWTPVRHDIFESPEFKEFQVQLIRAMTREEQVLPTDIPTGLVEVLQRQAATIEMFKQRFEEHEATYQIKCSKKLLA